MKIIAFERELPGATTEAFKIHAEAEARRTWQLHQEGVIRELYFRDDRSEAVLVLECEDVAAAHAVLQTLPLVANGLITFDLIPLKAYPGFGRLFNK